MEWLKAILEKAVITDGKLDVEATMKTINAEFPKHAVPKQDYNDKVKELSTANDTIKDLKKNNADNADLQQKVKAYETEVAGLKTAAENTRKEYAATAVILPARLPQISVPSSATSENP